MLLVHTNFVKCVRIGGVGSDRRNNRNYKFSSIFNSIACTTTSPSAPAKVAYVLLGRHGFVANGYIRAVRPFEIGEFVRKSFVKYIVEHLGSTGKFRGKCMQCVQCTDRHINSSRDSRPETRCRYWQTLNALANTKSNSSINSRFALRSEKRKKNKKISEKTVNIFVLSLLMFEQCVCASWPWCWQWHTSERSWTQ